MSKKIVSIITLATGLVFNVKAYALPELKCITSSFPTTSFFMNEKESNIELTVINHNGAEYAPVYSGIVTPSDIGHIRQSGEFFKKIGDYFTIQFEKKNCKIEEDKYYTCYTNEESKISGHTVSSVYFTTSESIDKIPDFEFTRTNVRLNIRENKTDMLQYKLEMSFYDNDCEMIKK